MTCARVDLTVRAQAGAPGCRAAALLHAHTAAPGPGPSRLSPAPQPRLHDVLCAETGPCVQSGNLDYHTKSLQNLAAAVKKARRLCAVMLDTIGRELIIRRPHDLDETVRVAAGPLSQLSTWLSGRLCCRPGRCQHRMADCLGLPCHQAAQQCAGCTWQLLGQPGGSWSTATISQVAAPGGWGISVCHPPHHSGTPRRDHLSSMLAARSCMPDAP